MKTRYNWQTDAEETWEQSLGHNPPQKSPQSSRRKLWLLLVLVCGAFVFVFGLARLRIQSREKILISDVLAADGIIEKAIDNGDLELFTASLSGDDQEWVESQRRLFLSNKLVDRNALDLQQAARQSTTPSAALDPDWRQATVLHPVTYELQSTDGSTITVILNQTRLFKAKDGRWLLSHPDEDFWGGSTFASTQNLVSTFPARDEMIVGRIINDLENDISLLCNQVSEPRQEAIQIGCGQGTPIRLDFETNSDSLLNLTDIYQSFFQDQIFRLPTPTLIGLPADEAAYRAIYEGYTSRILRLLRSNIPSPISLPDQKIAALCFPEGENRLYLYIYDLNTDTWTMLDTDRSYFYLQPMPNDDGLILRGGYPGVDVGRLQLAFRRADQETLLVDTGNTDLSARLVGIADRPQGENLLISYSRGSTGITTYNSISLESCNEEGCQVADVSGFPVWSPDGRHTLITREANLFLGDEAGQITGKIDRGFNPFWFDPETFGYIRLLGSEGTGGPEMELVLRSLTTGQIQPIIRSRELSARVTGTIDGNMRLQYVSVSPIDPNVLFMAASTVSGGEQQFYILKLTLEGDVSILSDEVALADIEVLQSVEDLPTGDPLVLTPTGYRPFVLTGDGKRLMTVHFVDPFTSQWNLRLYDIGTKDYQTINVNFPPYPAPFPFYDWSLDWQWLLLIDNGYIRLVAPDQNYERIVTHDFTACRYSGWIN